MATLSTVIDYQVYDLAKDTNNCIGIVPKGDTTLRGCYILLVNNGKSYAYSDRYTYMLQGKNAGDKSIVVSCDLYTDSTTNTNYIHVPYTNNMVAYAGVGTYQVSIYDGASSIETFPFKIFVSDTPFDIEDTYKSSEYKAFSDLINKIYASGGTVDLTYVYKTTDTSTTTIDDTDSIPMVESNGSIMKKSTIATLLSKAWTYVSSKLAAIATSGSYSDLSDTPTKLSDFTNDLTETDPTVPDWAKESTKPEYTYIEVGALPEDTKLSDLEGDSTHRLVTDEEITSWDNKISKPESATDGQILTYNSSSDSWIAKNGADGTQSDWNQTDNTKFDYIKNKPTSLPASDVYEWAKSDTKPSYTASEVGALSTFASLGDLYDDSYHRVVTDDEKATWNSKLSNPIPKEDGQYLSYDAKSDSWVAKTINGKTDVILVDDTTSAQYRLGVNNGKLFIEEIITTWDPGLYDSDDNLLCSWDESGIDVSIDYTSSTYSTETTSPYYVITNNYPDTTKIVVPSTITTLGEDAFYECETLTEIIVYGNITSIGTQAFSGCAQLLTFDIPSTVTSIGEGAFASCTALNGITLPDEIEVINSGTFYRCYGLTNIVIPNNVTSIKTAAFGSCGISNLTLSSSLLSIDTAAFNDCTNLLSVVIPSGVTSIGDSAFVSCSKLESVTIPDTVTTIGNNAFSNCTSIASLTIPDTVTTIGGNAFYGVRHIYYNGTATGSPWGASAIN